MITPLRRYATPRHEIKRHATLMATTFRLRHYAASSRRSPLRAEAAGGSVQARRCRLRVSATTSHGYYADALATPHADTPLRLMGRCRHCYAIRYAGHANIRAICHQYASFTLFADIYTSHRYHLPRHITTYALILRRRASLTPHDIR